MHGVYVGGGGGGGRFKAYLNYRENLVQNSITCYWRFVWQT